MKTKDKILQTSLLLFNQQGERVVTTNHIAAELGMSTGNLYYHFKNKQEIISQLLDQFQESILDVLTVPEREMTLADKIGYFEGISETVWAYRFLNRDLLHLMDVNSSLADKYPELANTVRERGERIYARFVASGLMHATADEIHALMINIWIVLTNWANFLSMSGVTQQTDSLDPKWVKRGLRQMVYMEYPYATKEIQQELDKLLQEYKHS